MKSPWLAKSILVTVMGVITMSILHYGTCQFWANPKAWSLYERTNGRLPDAEHMACKEVGPKTIAAITSMLATLLALHSEPPT
jgi:hypothetical protein